VITVMRGEGTHQIIHGGINLVALCPRCGSNDLFYKGSSLRCRTCDYVEYDEGPEDFVDREEDSE
jgi:hypothetical protein